MVSKVTRDIVKFQLIVFPFSMSGILKIVFSARKKKESLLHVLVKNLLKASY